MKIGEILFIAALAGGFLIPTALFKHWWLFATFAVFFVCFGVVEALSVHFTGKSISQKFWSLKKTNPKAAWIIIGGMAIGWIALLLHFML